MARLRPRQCGLLASIDHAYSRFWPIQDLYQTKNLPNQGSQDQQATSQVRRTPRYTMHTMREHMDSTADCHSPDGPVVNPGPDSEAGPLVAGNQWDCNPAPAGIATGLSEAVRDYYRCNEIPGYAFEIPTCDAITRVLPGQAWLLANPDQCCLDYVTIQSSAGKLVLCSMQESGCSVEYKPIRKEDMATVELV